jgi:hypothetical protein
MDYTIQTEPSGGFVNSVNALVLAAHWLLSRLGGTLRIK